jgi:hypothetical protein
MLMVVPFEYERFHSRSFILQHLLTYNDGLENRIKQKKEEERNEQTKEKSSFYVQVFVASPFFFIHSRFQQQMLHVIQRRV